MPTLYSNEASGNSYKARLLASFLNIPLDIIQLDLQNGEQRGDKFLAINPQSEVPTLVDGDLILGLRRNPGLSSGEISKP